VAEKRGKPVEFRVPVGKGGIALDLGGRHVRLFVERSRAGVPSPTGEPTSPVVPQRIKGEALAATDDEDVVQKLEAAFCAGTPIDLHLTIDG
jgi:hypothetical protein